MIMVFLQLCGFMENLRGHSKPPNNLIGLWGPMRHVGCLGVLGYVSASVLRELVRS